MRGRLSCVVVSVSALALAGLAGCSDTTGVAFHSGGPGGSSSGGGSSGGGSSGGEGSGAAGQGGAQGGSAGAGATSTGGAAAGGAGGASTGGAGGLPGGGGQGGSPGPSCEELEAEVKKTLAAAQTCDPVSFDACEEKVAGLCCDEVVAFASSPETATYLGALGGYFAAGCVPAGCPAQCGGTLTSFCSAQGLGSGVCVAF